MKTKILIMISGIIILSGCSEFALLASGSSIAISHNTYVKAYNGVDVLTIMNTDKDIKKHIYEQLRDKTTAK
tara:strand:+ start:371 stop:586 length:216 start_codon:yes stop_codon:yes gene_type:complete